jgi:hypothetical protein
MASLRATSAARALLTIFALLGTTLAGQGPPFSDWSAPVNLGPVVNSSFNDQAPAVSKHGLSLYFHSDRTGVGEFGANDLYVSRRSRIDQPWGPAANLGPLINTASFEARPNLSRDGHWLFFSSNRPGGVGGMDIWASYREHVHDDFAWQPPINLGPGVNTGSAEIGASYVENDDAGAPLLFFASNRPGGVGSFDIYMSEQLPDGTWGVAILVPELSTPEAEPGISVRFDGLEAFLTRGMPPVLNLWTSTRRTVFEPWSPPVALGPSVNSVMSDEAPHISADRRVLYFESLRDGGQGGRDLYMTTRTLGRR